RSLYRLAIDTGLRQGELLALQWGDINLERGILMVTRNLTGSRAEYDDAGNKIAGALQFTTPKTKAGVRIVPFPLASAEALRNQQAYVDQLRDAATTWTEHDLVFPSRVRTPLTPTNVGNRFRQRREAAGIPDAVFHSFRHTATSRLMLDNIPHPIAMALLGHKNIDTTMLYTHASEEKLIETMRAYFETKTDPEDA
ncbi:MAG TPA: site-specific integrase, partial [Thermomicrobiales bacterium]|nr:site-specific integrase [Thermomicrobiales bacterium]